MPRNPDHKQLVDRLANLAPEDIHAIVQQAYTQIRQYQALTIFSIEFDAKVPIAQRITAAGFSSVDPLIPQGNKMSYVGGPEDLVLLSFGIDVTSDEAVKDMARMELHPANLNELVAFATAYSPQTDRRVPSKPIAGVGISWVSKSRIIQPCLYPDGDRWQLAAMCERYNERWGSDFLFLAQRCCRRHK